MQRSGFRVRILGWLVDGFEDARGRLFSPFVRDLCCTRGERERGLTAPHSPGKKRERERERERQTDRPTDRPPARPAGRPPDRPTDRPTDRSTTDRPTHGRTDGRTDRQRDRETESEGKPKCTKKERMREAAKQTNQPFEKPKPCKTRNASSYFESGGDALLEPFWPTGPVRSAWKSHMGLRGV